VKLKVLCFNFFFKKTKIEVFIFEFIHTKNELLNNFLLKKMELKVFLFDFAKRIAQHK
jgi:hypothetical protein